MVIKHVPSHLNPATVALRLDLCVLGRFLLGLGRGHAFLSIVATLMALLWSDASVVSSSDACAAPW